MISYNSIFCHFNTPLFLYSVKLDKIDKLNKIDSIATSLENVNKRFKPVEDRLDVVKSRLTKAKSANSSLRADYDAFVEKSTQQIIDIKLRQEKFQENLDSLPPNSGDASGSVTDPKDKERLLALEAFNNSLISRVQCLQNNNSILAHSADLFIGGVTFSKRTDGYKIGCLCCY